MKKIKQIVPASLAKIMGLLYALLGLIVGVIFLFVSLIALAFTHVAGWFGLGAVILFPLMYGVMGVVFGYLTALLYNFAAQWTGGVEFEVE